MTVKELLEELKEQGESARIEAKTGSDAGKSVLETICAFANEPGLDGGHLLLGVKVAEPTLFEAVSYEVVGVPNPEKVVDELASQCASVFNRPIRPLIQTEQLNGKSVVHVRVQEAEPGEKPVFLKSRGLPGGAYRRIGSTDQRCTEDDLQLLFDERHRSPYDAAIVPDASLDDLDPDAVEEYRRIRESIKPDAEELRYPDPDLLQALQCARLDRGLLRPTVAGLLLFGKALALRCFFPMMRIDYIRVPGRVWMQNPHERFSAVEIRAPLFKAIRRAEAAIEDDLPKAFSLPEGSLQRVELLPIPRRVLREAVVNAVMHRSYRAHSPIQIIRYANRIEIKNPGYSLKSPDRLGEPRSETRNPAIAAVLHETHFAETKGTGIGVMRRLMREAGLVPPTFESSRPDNEFTARLLLHHFLSPEDLQWLDTLGAADLPSEGKMALVFVRETGAIDNAVVRDLSGLETLKASALLRHLCQLDLLRKVGKSTATYYEPGPAMLAHAAPVQPDMLDEKPSMADDAKPSMVDVKPSMLNAKPSMVDAKPSMLDDAKPSMVDAGKPDKGGDGEPDLFQTLPDTLKVMLEKAKAKESRQGIQRLIVELCLWKPLQAEELSTLLKRNSDYLKTTYLQPMVKQRLLAYTYPDMPRHPRQAYTVPDKENT
jgi:ATP-dependent DNA helicase RecG